MGDKNTKIKNISNPKMLLESQKHCRELMTDNLRLLKENNDLKHKLLMIDKNNLENIKK